MLVTQAHRFALDPTPEQQRALASPCGASRFAYNWRLALVKDRFEQRDRVRARPPTQPAGRPDGRDPRADQTTTRAYNATPPAVETDKR
ncbi:MAG: helix-turn-helix domain-containing protein [Solirubrobacteraceae bacterium]